MSPPLKACKTVLFCSFAAAFLSTAAAQTASPIGDETGISGALPGDQVFPATAFNATGGFAVWQDAKIDGRKQGQGIAAIRLDSALSSVGSPFRVNQRTAGQQQHPSLAQLSDGGAIVAWEGGLLGATPEIFARFLKPDGSFLTGDIQVSRSTVIGRSNQILRLQGYRNNRFTSLRFKLSSSYRVTRAGNQGVVTAALPDGGSVVVYSGLRRVVTNWMEVINTVKISRNRSYTNDLPQKFSARQDWMQDVFFQRFDASGRKVGGETLVNQFTKYNQRNPAVAVLPDGKFVVTWVSENFVPISIEVAHAKVDIMARLFSAAGEPLGNEFTVNAAPRPSASPSVSAMSDGRFTVAWAGRDGVRTNGWDIYGRVFSAAGVPEGSAFPINTHTYGDQFGPRICSVGTNQLVIWTSLGQDKIQGATFTQVTREGGFVTIPTDRTGSWQSVYGRALSDGAPVGVEVRINTTLARQLHPAVSGDPSGRFLATWARFGEGDGFDLYRRAFATAPAPTSERGTNGAGQGNGTVSVTLDGSLDNLRLNWATQPGGSYRVQTSVDLIQWSDLGGPRSSTGSTDSIRVDASEPARFFRVLRVQ